MEKKLGGEEVKLLKSSTRKDLMVVNVILHLPTPTNGTQQG